MKTLLLKINDEKHCSFTVIHTDQFKITNKCIYYSCGGNNRILKSELLTFIGTTYDTTVKEHDEIKKHFMGLDNDYLIECTNGDMISFDHVLNEWIVNDEEIINGEDIKEAISSILDEVIPSQAV